MNRLAIVVSAGSDCYKKLCRNALKHSGVRYFTVNLNATAGEVQLTVSDLGAGFNPDHAINRRGLGLISMRGRMQLVNGNLSIKSQPGNGTTIHARFFAVQAPIPYWRRDKKSPLGSAQFVRRCSPILA